MNEIKLPPLPEKEYLGDDVSYGYESWDMEEYARAAGDDALQSQGEYSFDDMGIGIISVNGRSLKTQNIPRPPGFINNSEWYGYAKAICSLLNGVNNDALASPEVQALREALEEIINCPQSVDEATIPAGGVEVNPAQVILTMSVSLVRIRKARTALAAMEKQK